MGEANSFTLIDSLLTYPNAFRVLGLSVNASVAEVQATARELHRKAQAGFDQAIARVSRGDLRMLDRLFWFHVRSDRDATGGRSEHPVQRQHDLVLHHLFDAYGERLDLGSMEQWWAALRAWSSLISNEDFWSELMRLEDAGGFIPPVSTEDFEKIRRAAVTLAAEPVIDATRASWESDDPTIGRQILEALKGLETTEPWAAQVKADILRTLFVAVARHLADASQRIKTGFAHPQPIAEGKAKAAAALAEFRALTATRIDPLLALDGSLLAVKIRGICGLFLCDLSGAFRLCADFEAAERLLVEAAELSRGSEVESRVAQALDEWRTDRANPQNTPKQLRGSRLLIGVVVLLIISGAGQLLRASNVAVLELTARSEPFAARPDQARIDAKLKAVSEQLDSLQTQMNALSALLAKIDVQRDAGVTVDPGTETHLRAEHARLSAKHDELYRSNAVLFREYDRRVKEEEDLHDHPRWLRE